MVSYQSALISSYTAVTVGRRHQTRSVRLREYCAQKVHKTRIIDAAIYISIVISTSSMAAAAGTVG